MQTVEAEESRHGVTTMTQGDEVISMVVVAWGEGGLHLEFEQGKRVM